MPIPHQTTDLSSLTRDPATGKYILYYDASLHNESNCRREVWWTLFAGLCHGDKDYKMEYGTAFHKAMVSYYTNGSVEAAVQVAVAHLMDPTIFIPDGEWRNPAHLANCVMQYVAHYQKEGDLLRPRMTQDGKPMLERTFAYPFYSTARTDVLLSGTMDFLGHYNGYPVLVDHKTTALTQVESYLDGYRMSPQLMLYKIIHDRLFGGDIGCMINGVFLSRANKNTFKRRLFDNFGPTTLARFERHLSDTIIDIVTRFEWLLDHPNEPLDALFPCNFTCCNKKFGMCEYLPLCSTDEVNLPSVLQMEFTRRVYNPLKFQA